MEFTAQNVEYAVTVFYNGEQNDRAKAHTWLTAAQRVPEAWNFVWELLQPTKGTEVQFYAATTLHTKILRCWNEVPPESYDQLKEKLLQAVFTYFKGPKIVTNRLCISLAAFILQQGTLDIATILRPLSNSGNISLLLEVLTVIPEEFNSMTMGSVLRSKNRASLRQACPAVLDDMLQHLVTVYNDYSHEPPSEQLILSWTTAATCASSWLNIDADDSEFGPALPDRLPLFRALLTVVHVIYSCNEMVSDSALDACEACMSAARAAASVGDASRYQAAAIDIIACLSSLVAPIMEKDNVPNSPNEELLSALITCCVALGETHARTIVEAVEGSDDERAAAARRLLEILLDAQAAPGRYPQHETRSNLVFGFWYTLQDEILNRLDLERRSEMNNVWRDVFSRLLTVLIHKSEVAAEETMSKDDLENLRCYRQDTADTVMYCFAMLGGWCWTQTEAEVRGATAGAGGAARREAALHVFHALGEAAPGARAPPALHQLLRHAVRQAHAPDSPRALDTALHCLGGYAPWLCSTGAGGAQLAQECMLAAGGALARAPAQAALALRKLCADCTAPAADLAPDIVRAAQSGWNQDPWTRRQLIGAAGAALSGAEREVAAPLLRELAATLYEDLMRQAADPMTSSCAAECCATLLGSLTSQPTLAEDLFRALAPTLPAFANHPSLVEPMFSILNQTVSALMGDCLPLMGDIAELTVASFNNHPCASGLDFVKLVALVCGYEWAGSRELLRVSVGSVAQRLANNVSAAPDLAEGMFLLLQAVTKKRPLLLDALEDLLPGLVELACSCIVVWEARTARAGCCWLSALTAQRVSVVQSHAPALTTAALTCIGGATPRNFIQPLAELLLAMNRAEWSRAEDAGLAVWLRRSLATPGFPSPHATDAHKHNFIAAVVKEKSSKRRLLEAVQEFSLICRGLVGTEYARQSIASKQLVA